MSRVEGCPGNMQSSAVCGTGEGMAARRVYEGESEDETICCVESVSTKAFMFVRMEAVEWEPQCLVYPDGSLCALPLHCRLGAQSSEPAFSIRHHADAGLAVLSNCRDASLTPSS